MPKFLIMVFILASGFFARAKSAYYSPEAFKICRGLTFDSDVTKCMSTIKNMNFDSSVISMCAGETFSSDKIACLQTIANKRYTSVEELSICRSKTFSSDRKKCLLEASTTRLNSTYSGPANGSCLVSRDEARDVMTQIDDAIYSYRRNDTRGGELLLESLKGELQRRSQN